MQQARDDAAAALRLTKEKMQNTYEKGKRNAHVFNIGDFVLLRTKDLDLAQFTSRPNRALSNKFVGPYRIVASPGADAFTLRLPAHITIHPTFSLTPNLIVSETFLEILIADLCPFLFLYGNFDVSSEILNGGRVFWSFGSDLTLLSSHTIPLISLGLHHSLMYSFLCFHSFAEAAMPKTMWDMLVSLFDEAFGVTSSMVVVTSWWINMGFWFLFWGRQSWEWVMNLRE